jgi:hypothetical protein
MLGAGGRPAIRLPRDLKSTSISAANGTIRGESRIHRYQSASQSFWSCVMRFAPGDYSEAARVGQSSRGGERSQGKRAGICSEGDRAKMIASEARMTRHRRHRVPSATHSMSGRPGGSQRISSILVLTRPA